MILKQLAYSCVFSLCTFWATAQQFDGYYVTNQNDTISCKFITVTNLFDKTMLYQTSVQKKVTVVVNGNETSFKPMDIKSFRIKGTKWFGDQTFVSLPQDQDNFYHLIVDGKLSYFFSYTKNMQSGGAPIPSPFLKKGDQLVEINGNRRKKVGELISDNPELYNAWMNSKKYPANNLEPIVKDYNNAAK